MNKMVCAFLLALLASGIAFGSDLTGTFVKEFQGVTRFEMDSSFISAELKGSSGSAVKIEAFDLPKSVRVSLDKSGGTLILRVEKEGLLPIPSTSARFVITLPASADCELASASGSIKIEGMNGTKMKIRSASGSVKCLNMSVPLDIDTASGSIGIGDSDTGKLLASASGAITLENSKGDAVITTASGSISLKDIQGAIKAQSASGSIRVSRFTGRLYLDSASGAIFGESVKLSGESTFESISGSIKLNLENRDSDFTISAKTVSGGMAIFDSNARGDFHSGSGAWALSLKTVSGSISVQ